MKLFVIPRYLLGGTDKILIKRCLFNAKTCIKVEAVKV